MYTSIFLKMIIWKMFALFYLWHKSIILYRWRLPSRVIITIRREDTSLHSCILVCIFLPSQLIFKIIILYLKISTFLIWMITYSSPIPMSHCTKNRIYAPTCMNIHILWWIPLKNVNNMIMTMNHTVCTEPLNLTQYALQVVFGYKTTHRLPSLIQNIS